MSEIIYGQYNATEFPLKHFCYREIPEHIGNQLFDLNRNRLAYFRGGLSYIFLTGNEEYQLKDFDMFSLAKNRNAIFDSLNDADVIFVNRNTFGETVVTAFWRVSTEFYKLDILLTKELLPLTEVDFKGRSILTVSVQYIWKNRLEKIAEKKIRNHDDKKTLNHYKVAFDLTDYIIRDKIDVSKRDIENIKTRRSEIESTLKLLIASEQLQEFMSRLDEVLV